MRSEIASDSVRGTRRNHCDKPGGLSWENFTPQFKPVPGSKDIAPGAKDSERAVDPIEAAIHFDVFYQEQRQQDFEDAICSFKAFYELIRHNPYFKREIEALRQMIEAEAVLNQFSEKVQKL